MTVLFTDLVGSTELMTRLGDLFYDDLRGEHFARLREAVVTYDGAEVKNTGDGLLVTFGAAADAVRAAVAIQQVTERHARTAGVALSVRVGVALGDVTFEDGDVFGTPVVEAARLVAAARPGQIIATAVVRMVAGSRSGAAFTDLGALNLKGLSGPLAACEVAWEPLADAPPAAVPLPSLLVGAGRIFVGREDELQRLHQRWKEVGVGERRLVLLGGEPGVGKTRLATELAHSLRAEGALVLAGRCDEDLGVPYQPMVEALRHYLAHVSPLRLGRHAGELGRLLPDLAQLVPGLSEPLRSDPETERYRLFDAVAAWLSETSVQSPVLLVLDDLQWAAKPTLLLLRHVMRSPDPMKLLVVATYRDTDVGRGHPLAELLADVPRLEGAERLPLNGLDVPAVAAFLAQAAGHDLDDEGDELARVVWRETEGNAFFVAEVLRHLVESRAIEERDGRWVLTAAIEDLGIPEGVRDVVGRRLSRLSDEANRVLACASVVGLEFDPALVQGAGGFAEEAVLVALEEAVATRLLLDVPGAAPRNRFAHALVRATLYDELTAARRVALHRKVAEGIEAQYASRLDDHLPALAHHWARASAPAAETDRAVDYATRAGDRALAQLAHDEAIVYYRSALDLLSAAGGRPGDDARRLELLISLGESQRRAGDPARRETLLEAARLARARGDADALARAALANARATLSARVGLVDTERVEALELALSGLGPEDSPTRARLLAALSQELLFAGDRERRVRLSQDALDMARRLGDTATLAHVLMERFFSISAPTTLRQRLSDSEELLPLAQALGDPTMTVQALVLNVRNYAEACRFEEADRHLEAAERLVDELSQPTLRWLVANCLLVRVLLRGHLSESERLIKANFELGQATGQSDAPIFLAVQLFQLRFEQGRLGELEGQIVEAAAGNPHLPLFQAYLALLYCESDRPDDARDHYERLAGTDFSGLPMDNTWMPTVATTALVCAHLSHGSGASVLHGMLLPYADQFVFLSGGAWGAVTHLLGLLATTLGHFDEAEARFVAAAETHQRIDAPTWLARTRLEWARMLLARRRPGDVEQARDLLELALATAVDLGLAPIDRRARELLERAR